MRELITLSLSLNVEITQGLYILEIGQMKLMHYVKLYSQEAEKSLEKLSKEQLVKELLSHWTIKEWKLFEKENTK